MGASRTYSREEFKARLKADGQIIGLEGVWKTRAGNSLYARENARVVRDRSGEILYYEGTVEDISERKRAEKEIVLLAHALKTTRECVSITDLEDRIFFVNDAFTETYGYTQDELIGKNIAMVRSDRTTQGGVKLITPETQEGDWQGELLNIKKDGTEFPISLSTSVIRDTNGVPFALLGVAQDITERKRAEADLHNAKEAAEAANRAKSEFLANMSHEIRTPMNGIIGMTELALDTNLTQEQREYLMLVKISADSLLSVVNDILDFSKIEAGKMELDPVEFDLGGIIGETIKTLAARAEEKKLELACHILPGVPVDVVGDSGRLRQVLVNLIGNAIKFTNEGEVVVRVETEERTPEDVLLHFIIRDTGIGIPVEKQALIFEAFAQADGSTTRKYGGTGLGLAISAQLVELMQGRIWVESPVDCGSRISDCGLSPSDDLDSQSVNPKSAIRNPKSVGSAFHFTSRFGLQKRRSANQCSPDMEENFGKGVGVNETARPSKSLRILVAEDSAVNRKLMTMMLEKRGHRPQLAANGLEALAALNEEKFDLVLMDVQMPEMNGFEATGIIRQKELITGDHIPIIALTAHAMMGDKERCIEAGMDDYLSKPIRSEELFHMIENLLGTAVASKSEAAAPDAVDSNGLLDYFHGDKELLGEIIEVFLIEYPGMFAEVRAAVESRDAKQLEKTAHRLKGSIGVFHAIPAYNVISQLVLMGRNADMGHALEAARELECELERMKEALTAIRMEQPV